jgi:hypothetical protein
VNSTKASRNPLAWQKLDVLVTGPLVDTTIGKMKYQIALRLSLMIRCKTRRWRKHRRIMRNYLNVIRTRRRLTQAHDSAAMSIARDWLILNPTTALFPLLPEVIVMSCHAKICEEMDVVTTLMSSGIGLFSRVWSLRMHCAELREST